MWQNAEERGHSGESSQRTTAVYMRHDDDDDDGGTVAVTVTFQQCSYPVYRLHSGCNPPGSSIPKWSFPVEVLHFPTAVFLTAAHSSW